MVHYARVGQGRRLEPLLPHPVKDGAPFCEHLRALAEVRACHLVELLCSAVLQRLENVQGELHLPQAAERLEQPPGHLALQPRFVPDGAQEHVQVPQHLGQFLATLHLKQLAQQLKVHLRALLPHGVVVSKVHAAPAAPERAATVFLVGAGSAVGSRSTAATTTATASNGRPSRLRHLKRLQPAVERLLHRKLHHLSLGQAFLGAPQHDVGHVDKKLVSVVRLDKTKALVGSVVLHRPHAPFVARCHAPKVLPVVLRLGKQLSRRRHAPTPPPGVARPHHHHPAAGACEGGKAPRPARTSRRRRARRLPESATHGTRRDAATLHPCMGHLDSCSRGHLLNDGLLK
mmetsp:Transcript_26472/g.49980  ORF Transcript_26472/g.49980 Transcript_26472/m.49980 type:complete len:345 (+) Transcript_26472:1475-2509(+)